MGGAGNSHSTSREEDIYYDDDDAVWTEDQEDAPLFRSDEMLVTSPIQLGFRIVFAIVGMIQGPPVPKSLGAGNGGLVVRQGDRLLLLLELIQHGRRGRRVLVPAFCALPHPPERNHHQGQLRELLETLLLVGTESGRTGSGCRAPGTPGCNTIEVFYYTGLLLEFR